MIGYREVFQIGSVGFAAALLWACGPSGSAAPPVRAHSIQAVHPASSPALSVSAPPTASASATAVEEPAKSAEVNTASEGEKKGEGQGEAAERVLFLATHLRTDELRKVCPKELADGPRVKCLIAMRYEDDRESQKLALALYDETGSLPGLLPEEKTDNGRGVQVRLLPARPIAKNRIHLEWIAAAFRDYAQFKQGLEQHAGPIAFRDRPIHFRFFYSEKGGMPSAFAVKNNIGYNLYGAVNVSEEAVRETLFHEIFHLNDGERESFSEKHLGKLYADILARCGKSMVCLTPYAPTDTKMNGFFYAFAPRSGVREYAAELALRYYREQRLMLRKEPLPGVPFKCGPPENARAYQAIRDAFFGGADLVPPCDTP